MNRPGPPQTFGQIVIQPKADPYAPKTSWWLEPESRDAFHAAAAKESLRMRLSREHQKLNPVTVGLPREWR